MVGQASGANGHTSLSVGHEFHINGHISWINGYASRMVGHAFRIVGQTSRIDGHATRMIGHVSWRIAEAVDACGKMSWETGSVCA